MAKAKFVNFSNHPSTGWSEKQLSVVPQWGATEVVDVAFPAVPASATSQQVEDLAEQYAQQILDLSPCAVMAQGEFTLAFSVVRRLKAKGIPTVAACSDRRAVEQVLPDGSTRKTAVFEFVQFREF